MIPADQRGAAMARRAVTAQQQRRIDLEGGGRIGRDVGGGDRPFDAVAGPQQQAARLARMIARRVRGDLFGGRTENPETHRYIT